MTEYLWHFSSIILKYGQNIDRIFVAPLRRWWASGNDCCHGWRRAGGAQYAGRPGGKTIKSFFMELFMGFHGTFHGTFHGLFMGLEIELFMGFSWALMGSSCHFS